MSPPTPNQAQGQLEAGKPALFLDADGCLFPSEEIAFVASSQVANELLEAAGLDRRYAPEELRRSTLGRNFRDTARRLLAEGGIDLPPSEIEDWVKRERTQVTAALASGLRPDASVIEALSRLQDRFRLAVVTSSATSRLLASLEATGLSGFFPPEHRFSAEDSLQVPTSKPEPAVYLFAARQLGVESHGSTAVEDSPPGVASAVAAGMKVIGNLAFARQDEQDSMSKELLRLGALGVVRSWEELGELLAA